MSDSTALVIASAVAVIVVILALGYFKFGWFTSSEDFRITIDVDPQDLAAGRSGDVGYSSKAQAPKIDDQAPPDYGLKGAYASKKRYLSTPMTDVPPMYPAEGGLPPLKVSFPTYQTAGSGAGSYRAASASLMPTLMSSMTEMPMPRSARLEAQTKVAKQAIAKKQQADNDLSKRKMASVIADETAAKKKAEYVALATVDKTSPAAQEAKKVATDAIKKADAERAAVSEAESLKVAMDAEAADGITLLKRIAQETADASSATPGEVPDSASADVAPTETAMTAPPLDSPDITAKEIAAVTPSVSGKTTDATVASSSVAKSVSTPVTKSTSKSSTAKPSLSTKGLPPYKQGLSPAAKAAMGSVGKAFSIKSAYEKVTEEQESTKMKSSQYATQASLARNEAARLRKLAASATSKVDAAIFNARADVEESKAKTYQAMADSPPKGLPASFSTKSPTSGTSFPAKKPTPTTVPAKKPTPTTVSSTAAKKPTPTTASSTAAAKKKEYQDMVADFKTRIDETVKMFSGMQGDASIPKDIKDKIGSAMALTEELKARFSAVAYAKIVEGKSPAAYKNIEAAFAKVNERFMNAINVIMQFVMSKAAEQIIPGSSGTLPPPIPAAAPSPAPAPVAAPPVSDGKKEYNANLSDFRKKMQDLKDAIKEKTSGRYVSQATQNKINTFMSKSSNVESAFIKFIDLKYLQKKSESGYRAAQSRYETLLSELQKLSREIVGSIAVPSRESPAAAYALSSRPTESPPAETASSSYKPPSATDRLAAARRASQSGYIITK